MPADDVQTRAQLADAIGARLLRARPDNPGGRTSAALLGLTFQPGDPVVDRVTGRSGTVLYATRHAIVHSPTEPAAG